ncbi:MAG: hypothetical protein GAK31_03344 [Stenotrophomonas maltophilia]|uniref:Secreted protein n=1 Tax=Stenotrophomonas maltophilia TaxID=40324 RepID=A0A7V8FDE6_STEMA|nr:MAG: hypothetical protein GAK31_03344 [Stenotrophomonas maltophilia]
MRTSRTSLALLRPAAVLALLLPLLAGAAAPPAPTGTPRASWVGSLDTAGRPTSLRVLDSGDGRQATLEFGEPYNCRLQARRSPQADGRTTLALLEANGGPRCNRLNGGTATLAADGTHATLQLPGAAAAAALWKPGQGAAADSATAVTQGRWQTTVTGTDQWPIGLQLVLAAREPGDRGSELAYASPRSCRVPLRHEGSDARGSWYSVLPGNGGQACDRLLGQWLQVSASDGAAQLSFQPGTGECVPACSLQRTP